MKKIGAATWVLLLISMILVPACQGPAPETPLSVEPTAETAPTAVEATPVDAEPPTEAAGVTSTGQVQYWASPEEYQEATGREVGALTESPASAEKVAAGDLPPVEQRVPEEPLVIMPADEVADFGGTLREADRGRFGFLEDLLNEFPLTYSSDMQEILPNIFKGWEVSQDGRVFTFTLRKGMKWSDGQPFTTADFVFWYDDIALNEELRPNGVDEIKVKGEMGRFEALDENTLRVTFSEPNGVFLEILCRFRPVPFAPAHYMKQFHPRYTSKEELDRKVQGAGFSSWVELFEDELYYYNNPKVPTVFPWKPLNRNTDPVHYFERNPYYWKVDVEGNQLPYIDRIERPNYHNLENVVLAALAGDVDELHPFFMQYSENYALMKKNEEQGNYRLVPAIGWSDNWAAISFNFSHEDPVWREIFADQRFRIALSHAINRQEINDLLFLGLNAMPSSPAPPDGPPYFGESEGFTRYAAYEPKEASELLDEMGLVWNATHTVRLRPDGEPLEAVLTVLLTGPGKHVEISETYKKYFADIGFQVSIKPLDYQLFSEVLRSGSYDLAVSDVNWGGRRPIITGLRNEPLPLDDGWIVNPPWGAWIASGGKTGEEPPEDVKTLFALHQAFAAEADPQKRIEIETEIFRIHNDNLWVIASNKKPADSIQDYYQLVHNRLINMPIPVAPETPYMAPSQWAIEK